MHLDLEFIEEIDGIYGSPPDLPRRMRWLHPEAARAIRALTILTQRALVCSDVFRSPEASLLAAQEKRGVQPPGYSAHNFGLAIDVDVETTCTRWGCTYTQLLAKLAAFGWHCHRRDGRRGFEDWHFNFLGADERGERYLRRAELAKPRTWALPVAEKIVDLYGDDFDLDASEVQERLRELRLYSGKVDGIAGPLTRQAADAFSRAWRLGSGDLRDPHFQRTLAIVTARGPHIAA